MLGPRLPLPRVLALVGGVELINSFFMPWIASQGLLQSGQFLNDFLSSASPADLQRFVPGITRLPPGSASQIGLWLIACGALGVVVGAAFEFGRVRR